MGEFFTRTSSSNRFMSIIAASSKKLGMVELLEEKRTICISFPSSRHHAHAARFVPYFSEEAVLHPSWKQKLTLVMQLPDSKPSPKSIIAIDCDMEGPVLV